MLQSEAISKADAFESNLSKALHVEPCNVENECPMRVQFLSLLARQLRFFRW